MTTLCFWAILLAALLWPCLAEAGLLSTLTILLLLDFRLQHVELLLVPRHHSPGGQCTETGYKIETAENKKLNCRRSEALRLCLVSGA